MGFLPPDWEKDAKSSRKNPGVWEQLDRTSGALLGGSVLFRGGREAALAALRFVSWTPPVVRALNPLLHGEIRRILASKLKTARVDSKLIDIINQFCKSGLGVERVTAIEMAQSGEGLGVRVVTGRGATGLSVAPENVEQFVEALEAFVSHFRYLIGS